MCPSHWMVCTHITQYWVDWQQWGLENNWGAFLWKDLQQKHAETPDNTDVGNCVLPKANGAAVVAVRHVLRVFLIFRLTVQEPPGDRAQCPSRPVAVQNWFQGTFSISGGGCWDCTGWRTHNSSLNPPARAKCLHICRARIICHPQHSSSGCSQCSYININIFLVLMSVGFNTSWQTLPWAESSQLLNDSWMRNYNIYDADTNIRISSLTYFAVVFFLH